MKQILFFLLVAPFKHRTLGFALLFVVLVIFFRYFELNPSGEKSDITVGPVTLHLNSLEIHRRTTAKPIDSQSDTIAPSLSNPSPILVPAGVSNDATDIPGLIEPPTVRFTPPSPIDRMQIRMGTVCLNKMDSLKFSDPAVQETLVATARQFDLLAVEGLNDFDTRVVKQWVELLNADGGTFAYLMAFPDFKNTRSPFVAFIYNRRAVDADRNTLLVLDSGDRLACAPIAALFTARSTDNRPAFTFIAMNVYIDPDRYERELPVLMDTFPLLQDYIKGEDDVIIFGDFGTNINLYSGIVRNPDLRWVLDKPISNYQGQPLTENILFYKTGCTEYQNQFGTFSVDKLSALPESQLSGFMPNPPVWGTFSVSEAGK